MDDNTYRELQRKVEQNVTDDIRQYRETTLSEIIERHPLEHGLTELLLYISATSDHAEWQEGTKEPIELPSLHDGYVREAQLPRIVIRK